MTIQLHQNVQNALLDAIENNIGTSPVLKIRSGAAPTHVTDADSGTVLATLNLPTDWMAGASGGTKDKSGTWQDASADAGGTAQHWRLYDSGAVCRMQGTVTAVGGGGDIEIVSTTITLGEVVTVTLFRWTAPNPP
jgi:hypothetical protein